MFYRKENAYIGNAWELIKNGANVNEVFKKSNFSLKDFLGKKTMEECANSSKVEVEIKKDLEEDIASC